MSPESTYHRDMLAMFTESTAVFALVSPSRPCGIFAWGQPCHHHPAGYLAAVTKSMTPLSAAGSLSEWLSERSVRTALYPDWVDPMQIGFLFRRRSPSRIEFFGWSAFEQSTGMLRRPQHPEVPASFDMVTARSVAHHSPLAVIGNLIFRSLVDLPIEL